MLSIMLTWVYLVPLLYGIILTATAIALFKTGRIVEDVKLSEAFYISMFLLLFLVPLLNWVISLVSILIIGGYVLEEYGDKVIYKGKAKVKTGGKTNV